MRHSKHVEALGAVCRLKYNNVYLITIHSLISSIWIFPCLLQSELSFSLVFKCSVTLVLLVFWISTWEFWFHHILFRLLPLCRLKFFSLTHILVYSEQLLVNPTITSAFQITRGMIQRLNEFCFRSPYCPTLLHSKNLTLHFMLIRIKDIPKRLPRS